MADPKIILAEISRDLDSRIKLYIKDEHPRNLIEAVRQYPYAGGKRIRPSLVIASCGAVGGEKSKSIPLAVAIEYIHNFTLIHDDIIDGDRERRGMPTSHTKYGTPTAILAGDALFGKAFNVLSELDVSDKDLRRILRSITAAVWDLARGQQMDINNECGRTVTIDDYIETIRLKTGVLFAASAVGGALIGGADDLTIEAICRYATSLGIAFQIFDDILGIAGDPIKTGKSVGNDIRRGKYTAITCHAAESIKDENEMRRFCSIFGKIDSSEEEIGVVRSILERSGSIAYAVRLAEKYSKDAVSELSLLTSSEDKDFMIDLARYAVTRSV
ncbi:MAG: polyprenyl synthetase family protein [archaeon]|nr:polyprenyl synthetase family protein [archaeon]